MYAVIYDEVLKSVEHLDIDIQNRVLRAFVDYQIEWKTPSSTNDPLVYSLFMMKKFDLDNLVAKASAQRQNAALWWAPRWNSNAVKTWEKVSKQPKSTQINPNQPEQEQEQEHEQENKQENKNITKTKTNMCNSTLHDTPSFDKFWNLYPNKKDKKKAKEKFSRLSDDKKQLAIDGISRLMKSEQWMKWYIPLPTTYLNGERREDEDSVGTSDYAKNQALSNYRRKVSGQFDEYLSANETTDVWNEEQTSSFDRRGQIFGT